MAEGKPIVEQPVEKAENPGDSDKKPSDTEKKPEEEKPDSTSSVNPTSLRSFVDAILEYWRIQPGQKTQAA